MPSDIRLSSELLPIMHSWLATAAWFGFNVPAFDRTSNPPARLYSAPEK
jgi:hypothetical protein